MKNTKKLLLLALALTMLLFAVSCNKAGEGSIWDDATYLTDTELGTGAITVTVSVVAEEKTVTFTVKTDKQILGDALLDNGLIAGEESTYGLYVKEVNGMTADYDTDGLYWAFYQGGAYMLTGVDSTPISGGEAFEIRLEK